MDVYTHPGLPPLFDNFVKSSVAVVPVLASLQSAMQFPVCVQVHVWPEDILINNAIRTVQRQPTTLATLSIFKVKLCGV